MPRRAAEGDSGIHVTAAVIRAVVVDHMDRCGARRSSLAAGSMARAGNPPYALRHRH